ncbi:MAG: hypothetical protein ABI273_17590 [Lacunisphaera sp.]
MSQANAEKSTVLHVTRRQVEAQIDLLIELLDTLDDPRSARHGLLAFVCPAANRLVVDIGL